MTQPLTPHRVIAERMKALRKKRGWSAAHLALEMKKAGIPWDRSIVASLELGRRATVTVEELLALSYVLSVAPVHLLVPPVGVEDRTPYQVVPNGPGGPDSVLAGSPPYPAVVRAWIRGQLPMGDPRSFFEEVPPSELAPPDEFGGAWRVVTNEDADGER
ncbi:helix-turn-helix domain-containing protein [Micromonospora sp. IBHARD004]|uniref:helix-turn-helix domain-containing protein n=1 Tax=Micromonospora sp. IBHARD004 TaxID=3457764 RepID=UPI004058DBAB